MTTDTSTFTLKNVKYSEFASHETNCFEATLYRDGVKVAFVENDGRGGSTCISPTDRKSVAFDAIRDDLNRAGLPLLPEYADMPELAWEGLLDRLLVNFLADRDLSKKLKRKVLYTRTDKAGVWQAGFRGRSAPPAEKLSALAKSVAFESTTDQVLNLLPIAEAVELFRTANAR